MKSSWIWQLAWVITGIAFTSEPFLLMLVILVIFQHMVNDKRAWRWGHALVKRSQWWYGGWWVLIAWMNAQWLLGCIAGAVFLLERSYRKHKKKKYRKHKEHGLKKALAAFAGGAALEKVMDNDQDEEANEDKDELFSSVQ